MNYKSHIYKFAVFFLLFVIGFIIYKQQIIYKERFQVKPVKPKFLKDPPIEEYKFVLSKNVQAQICNEFIFKQMSGRVSESEAVLRDRNLKGGGEIGWLRGYFVWMSTYPGVLSDKYPSIESDINIIKSIGASYMKFVYNNYDNWSTNWNELPTGLSISEWKEGTYKHMEELVVAFNNFKKKINCFGTSNNVDFKSIIKNMKRMRNILLNENINDAEINIYKKSIKNINDIFNKDSYGEREALTKTFKQDFMSLFGSNEIVVKPDKSDYRGFQNKTVSGKTCQKWTSQSPHNHNRTASNYPNKGIGDHNYCRNPDDHNTIWCYTTDSKKRWENCSIDNNTPFVLSQSHYKRKGTAKKIDNWILFIENTYNPTEGKDYNLLKNNNSKPEPDQSVETSLFNSLKIVSAGSYNAEQEQKNLPTFDIKDKGGYNLFRAVVVKPNIPVVSKSYSIKDSCQKEKEGIPLEMGNTPLILKNFARDTSAGSKNNRYDSSQYFGYPKLYIIENILEDGKNLNNKPKTYYLSYSGNTTRKTKNNPNVKPLYHIRAYNPISGKFDYAYDVGTTDSNSIVSLKVGRVDSSVDTSLFTIEPDVNEEKIALLSYGFRGYGENSGKNHYFYHKFDKSGRETESLSPINETTAKIWNLKKISV